ncbi:MAG: hypothetical protein ABIK73_06550 [candidate division WOR-3 bacterium]
MNFLFNLLLFDPKLFTGGDNAVYISLAESIASGNGYKDIFDPDNPPHTQYPFGLPLLLTPIVYVWGHNYILMKLLIIFIGLGLIYFLGRLLQQISTWEITLFVVLLTALNPYIIEYSHWILTEIPYLFFSILGIYLLERALNSQNRGLVYLIAGAGAIVYSYFIRPTGLALIAAGFLILLIKKRYKYALIYSAVILICVFPWFYRNARIGEVLGLSQKMLMMRSVYNMESGTMTFSELINRVLANLRIYSFTIIPQSIFYNIPEHDLGKLLLALILILPWLLGFGHQIIKKFSLSHLYFLSYFLIVLPWHEYVSTERYFLPVLPLFLYFVANGLITISNKLKISKSWLLGPYLVVISFISVFNIVKMAPTQLNNLILYLKGDKYAGYSPDWVRFFEAAEWIKANTPENSVVISRKPPFVYLVARRKGKIYPFTFDREKVKSFLFDSKAKYILVDHFYWTGTTPKYLIPVLQEYPDKYEILFISKPPETLVLKTKSD